MPRQRRISFDVDERTFLELNKLIPHGMKGYLYRFITQSLVRELRKGREDFLVALYEHRVKLMDMLEEEIDDTDTS